MDRRLTAVLTLLVMCAVSIAAPGAASAANILLYDDFILGADPWSAAITGLGHTLTTATSDANFALLLGTGTWDLAVLQLDLGSDGVAESALGSYVAGGKKAIASDWEADLDASFQVAQFNAYGGVNVGTLLLGPQFSAGVSSTTLPLSDPGYGVAFRTFNVLGGATIAGTRQEDGKAAIVIGNSGRTIMNGFMGEQLGFADEVQIYKNEISFVLTGGGGGPVPLPATAVLVALGMMTIGWRAVRRGRSIA